MATRTKPSPMALAQRLVEDWFGQILNGMSDDRPTIDCDRLADTCAAVQDAVLIEEGHSTDLPDAPDAISIPYGEAIDAAQRAGYLVGVQVGLRLRAAGGAK